MPFPTGHLRLRPYLILSLALVSACSWIGSWRHHPPPDPTLLIVTGAPAGALLFLDGAQSGEAVSGSRRAEQLTVSAGGHTLEVHLGDAVTYRESLYVASGEHRVVMVLSGQTRQ
jgi:hypothetical protein